jgi:hypothetical protein
MAALRRILWWIEPNRRVFRQDYRINRMGHLVNSMKNNKQEMDGDNTVSQAIQSK